MQNYLITRIPPQIPIPTFDKLVQLLLKLTIATDAAVTESKPRMI